MSAFVVPPLPDVVVIPLMPVEEGHITIVDACDFEQFADVSWRYLQGYAGLCLRDPCTLYLHRLIANAPEGLAVDHRNGNKLDNRRSNLRIATQQENMMNRAKNARNSQGGIPSSQYKGVRWVKEFRRWQARIHGRYLGQWESEERAAFAYDDAARTEYGEFACVNFPRAGERGALLIQRRQDVA